MIDLGTPIDWAAVRAYLAAIVPAEDLAATPQDEAFHAEGDVWTHTQMALEALVASVAYTALPAIERSIVATAVLLHDVGKPSTTRLDGDKLTSRGHSARGEHVVRVALWRQNVPWALREHVCRLVRYHQIPFFGITKPDADRLAIRLSLVTRNDWLVLVAEADGRGRRCADPADQVRILDHCALWLEHARELGVASAPRAFTTPHTRRVWLESTTRHPDVPAHDDTSCEVIVMSGLPASGKDTWLRTHHAALPVISLDDLRSELEVEPGEPQDRVIAAAREQARVYLRSATSFAWNATNLSASLRGQLLELFRSYRARTQLVYCETTVAEQAARNRSRREPVPHGVIDRMLERWTVPDPTEAHELTIHAGAPGVPTWPPTPESGTSVKG